MARTRTRGLTFSPDRLHQPGLKVPTKYPSTAPQHQDNPLNYCIACCRAYVLAGGAKFLLGRATTVVLALGPRRSFTLFSHFSLSFLTVFALLSTYFCHGSCIFYWYRYICSHFLDFICILYLFAIFYLAHYLYAFYIYIHIFGVYQV